MNSKKCKNFKKLSFEKAELMLWKMRQILGIFKHCVLKGTSWWSLHEYKIAWTDVRSGENSRETLLFQYIDNEAGIHFEWLQEYGGKFLS